MGPLIAERDITSGKDINKILAENEGERISQSEIFHLGGGWFFRNSTKLVHN